MLKTFMAWMMDVLFPLSLNMFYDGKKESPGLFKEN